MWVGQLHLHGCSATCEHFILANVTRNSVVAAAQWRGNWVWASSNKGACRCLAHTHRNTCPLYCSWILSSKGHWSHWFPAQCRLHAWVYMCTCVHLFVLIIWRAGLPRSWYCQHNTGRTSPGDHQVALHQDRNYSKYAAASHTHTQPVTTVWVNVCRSTAAEGLLAKFTFKFV